MHTEAQRIINEQETCIYELKNQLAEREVDIEQKDAMVRELRDQLDELMQARSIEVSLVVGTESLAQDQVGARKAGGVNSNKNKLKLENELELTDSFPKVRTPLH